MPARTALLIAGHGSQRNPGARAPICAAVQAMRADGAFDEVKCALLKEDPPFAGATARVTAPRVVILPYFMATGYYTDTVLPREMNVPERVTRRDGRAFIRAEAIGADPAIADVLLARAREAGFDGSQALVVLGHGTERNPDSARTTHEQVERLRARGVAPEVTALFIDQEPRMTGIFEAVAARDIVLVPMFAADGWHVSETVPTDLGMANGELVRNGRRLRYARAAGSAADMIPLVRARALAALAEIS